MSPVPSDLPGLRAAVEAGRYLEADQGGQAFAAARPRATGAGALDAAEALHLVLVSRRYMRRLNVASTIEIAGRALKLKEAAFGPDDPRLAGTLALLGLARAAARQHDAARLDVERALALCERSPGAQSLDYAFTLNVLGWLHRLANREALAEQTAQRALALARVFETPPGEEAAWALTTLASVARLRRDLEGAARYYEEARVVEERLRGPDHRANANTLIQLASAMRELGDPERSRLLQAHGVRLLETSPGSDYMLAFELIELSTLVDASGDYTEALAICERAVAVAERATGPDSTLTAAALGFMASIHGRLGDHAAAYALRLRTVALWTAAQGPDSVHAAMALNGLAIAYQGAGRLDDAFEAIERALKVEALRKQDADFGRVLQTHAGLLAARGQRREARAVLEQARSVSRTSKNATLFIEEGYILTDLAKLEQEDGETGAAIGHYRDALALFEGTLGPNNIRTAARRTELAALLAETGALDDARAALQAGEPASLDHLRLIARSLTDRRALEFAAERTSGLDLAMTLASTPAVRKPADADVAWDLVVRGRTVVLDEMAARQRRVVAEAGNPLVRERWRALNEARARLANLLVRGPTSMPTADYQALVDRTRATRDRAERDLAQASATFRDEQERTQAGLRDVLARLPRDAALVSYVRYTPRTVSRLTGLHGNAAPAKRAAAYAAFIGRPGRPPQIVPLGAADRIETAISTWRASIEAELNAAGVASRRTEAAYREAGGALRALIWDPIRPHLGPATSAFVVPDGALHLVDLATLPTGRARYLVEEPIALHYLLAERDLVQPPPEPRGRSLLALGAPDFDKVDRAAANPSFWRDAPVVDLDARLSSEAGMPSPPHRSRSVCTELTNGSFSPLPETRQEVDKIAALWRQGGGARRDISGEVPAAARSVGAPDVRPDRATAAGDVLLLEEDRATEAAFKMLAPGRRVLHLATHGFFLDRSCGLAGAEERESQPAAAPAVTGRTGAVLAGAPRAPGAAAMGARLLAEHPLLRSGLVLAGANRVTQTAARNFTPPVNAATTAGRVAPAEASVADDEDGILTAEEIAGLDLSAAQWAVLSACDTGRGDWQAGEGVLGLRRAFQVAGARTVILSLWPVIDSVASSWMAELYRGKFVREAPTAQAVRDANRALLAARRTQGTSTHPLYWAGFIASGDWR